VPTKIVDRGKFVLGVLAVWAVAHLIMVPYHVWQDVLRMDRWSYRLETPRLAQLSDANDLDQSSLDAGILIKPVPWRRTP
jgi:hypothetical protein